MNKQELINQYHKDKIKSLRMNLEQYESFRAQQDQLGFKIEVVKIGNNITVMETLGF